MSKWNPDATRIGWGIVALILVYGGLQHVASGRIWGRIRGGGTDPALEGWPVIVIGLVEASAGAYLAYRLLRKR